MDVSQASDIIVDFSALSIGVGFPIVRYLLDRFDGGFVTANVHVMATHHPDTDGAIGSTASDRADLVTGFRGDFGVDERSQAARLWLPHLIPGKSAVLERIHAFVQPHDTCPVLPFPCRKWRLGDNLLHEYRAQIEDTWQVDSRNIVYAAEDSPLDLYRTVLRIADARTRVFLGVGGSQVVLSPMGSKLLSIGTLMAAVERNFPVAYVEAASYTVDWPMLDSRSSGIGELVHVWLCGEAYAVLSAAGGLE